MLGVAPIVGLHVASGYLWVAPQFGLVIKGLLDLTRSCHQPTQNNKNRTMWVTFYWHAPAPHTCVYSINMLGKIVWLLGSTILLPEWMWRHH